MKTFKVAEIRKMLGWLQAEQISFSRMVEMMNEQVARKHNMDEAALVSFGNYLLSKNREKNVKDREAYKVDKGTIRQVHHADIANWKEVLKEQENDEAIETKL